MKNTGNSSIDSGTRLSGTSMPRRRLAWTSRSAMGSPTPSRAPARAWTLNRAPISCSMVSRPVRRRVDADVAQPQPVRRRQQPGHQEERRRGEVRRHGDGGARQRLAAGQARRGPLALHPHPEGREHPLGVIARGRRLRDPGAALRTQPGQQHRRFHLRAGHGHDVVDTGEFPAALQQHRRPAVVSRDLRAHLPQRPGHALHRPAHQRAVTDQRRGEGLPGQEAHRQPHCRAGVAHVERRRAHRADPPGARTVNDDVRVGSGRSIRTPSARERAQGRQAVFTGEEAADARFAAGDAAEHQRAM